MSKTITRKYIQRITKREGNTSIRQSGGGGGGGGASQYWVEENYISKLFFNQLFTVYDEDGNVVEPNDTESVIASIKSMFGFWTDAYLSALGNGEGGGAELTLASLADVDVYGVADGQALVWNATMQKWVPGQGGGIDITAMWAALAQSGVQQIDVSHLTTALTGYATETWVGNQGYITGSALNGYATESWVSSQISDMATQTWVSGNYLSQTNAASTYLTQTNAAATYLTKSDAATTYVSIAFFERLFKAYNGSTVVHPNNTTSTIDNIKAMFGFWTQQYISALGNGSGGSSGGIDMNTVWTALGNATNEQINATHLSNALSTYNPTSNFKTINGNSIIGTGNIDVAVAGDYLPLSGGTLTGAVALNGGLTPLGTGTVGTASGGGKVWFKKVNSTEAPNNGVVIEFGNSTSWVGQLYLGDNANQGLYWNGWYNGVRGEWKRFAFASDLSSYLPLSGGTVTGSINFSKDNEIKLKLYVDGEGGNIRITSPSTYKDEDDNQRFWEIDSYNGNLRFYSRNNGSTYVNFLTNGKITSSGLGTIWGSSNDGAGSGLDADMLDGYHSSSFVFQHPLPVKDGGQKYWHRIGNYSNANSTALVITCYAGDGWNSNAAQNEIIQIFLKKGYQSSPSAANSIGCQVFRYNWNRLGENGVDVVIVATSDTAGSVWLYQDKGYVSGRYTISGNWTWEHNNSSSDDTQTKPTSNNSGVDIKLMASTSDNVASATKLQTSRSIWGQSFDGTSDVSGKISNASGISLNQTGTGYAWIDFHYASSSTYTSNIYEQESGRLVINSVLNVIKGGNVGIGTTSPSYKLDVNGTLGVNGLITASGGITIPSGKTLTIGDAVLSWDSTNQGIKITKGLYSQTFISALGQGSSGESGVNMNTVWTALGNNTNEQINASHLSTALLPYATQTWVTQQIAASATGGTVTAVKVGTTTYNPTSGVVSLPDYLPLSGGTMSNTNLVANLNADLLDGYQANQLPLITTYGGTSIAANTDLNDILDAGTYYCISGSVATTLSNMPSYAGGNFRLWHIVNTGGDGNGSSQWSSQIFLAPNSGQMFIRSHNENVFGTWKEFAFSSDYLPLSGGTMTGTINCRGLIPTANNTYDLGSNTVGFRVLYTTYVNGMANQPLDLAAADGSGDIYITAAHLVGIATKSPSYQLHVNGTFYASGNSSIGGTLGVTGSTQLNGGLWVIGKTSASDYDDGLCVMNANERYSGVTVGRDANFCAEIFTDYDSTLAKWMFRESSTVTHTIDHPRKNGTIALTSDLDSYLPLSGGTMTGQITSLNIKPTTDNESYIGDASHQYLVVYAGYLNSGANRVLAIASNNGDRDIYIDTSHNIGIGHINPTTKLDVNGTLNATEIYEGGTLLSSIYLPLSGGTMTGTINCRGLIPTANNTYDLGSKSVGFRVLYTTYVNGMTNKPLDLAAADGSGDIYITAAHLVGIATKSPSYQLHVNGTLYASGNSSIGGTFGVTGATTLSSTLSVTSNTTVGGTLGVTGATTLSSTLVVSGNAKFSGYTGFGYDADTSYRVKVKGVVYASTGVYSAGYVTALSDIRHKDVQGNVRLTVREVANAPSVKFLWKDRRQEGMQVGSIAQYWKKVMPEAIVENADGELTMSYGVIALLASIATARKVEEHERRIAELERENKLLKEQLNVA